MILVRPLCSLLPAGGRGAHPFSDRDIGDVSPPPLGPGGQHVYAEAGGMKEQISVLIATRASGKIITAAALYPYKPAVPVNEQFLNSIQADYQDCPRSSNSRLLSAIKLEVIKSSES